MMRTFPRHMGLTIVMLACTADMGWPQTRVASWLDQPKPAPWNAPNAVIPAAPKAADVNPKCRDRARPAELDEDKRVQVQGWDLVGAYQGGWHLVVIRGTAGYDGMCRPQQYQDFVFSRGVFAGTLSPQAMQSRADGALTRVSLQGPNRLTAEYDRYAEKDPLCCPTRTTSVVFEIGSTPPVVQPVSATASK